MNVAGIGGYVFYGTSATTARRTTSTVTSDRVADNLDLQHLGRFLRGFRAALDDTRTTLATTGHARHRGRLTLTGTRQLALSAVGTAAELRGSRVLGGTAASFSPADPAWSAVARARPTVGGAYDGSNGTQTLSVVATQGGVVGSDTLQFEVRDESGTTLEQLTVDVGYNAGDDIALANGLTLQLGTGTVTGGASLAIAVSSEQSAGNGSFTPADPAWSAAARPTTTLGGTYDGSNGTQQLTLRVATGGRVGTDDLVLDVLDQDGAVLEQLNLAAGYNPGDALALANGLTVSLDAGALGAGDTFAFDVAYDTDTGEGSATPAGPDWTTAAGSAATVGGAYDGSLGTQGLTVGVVTGGVVGQDELRLNLLDAEGAVLQQVTVAADYAPGDALTLAGGLTLALGAGALTAGDSFALAVDWQPGSTQNAYTTDDTAWLDGPPPTVTLGGTYDGSNGSQTLTLRVAQGGAVGSDELLIDVLDAEGTTLEQLTVGAGYEPGNGVTLANGLTVDLAGGRLVAGDAFTVDVVAASDLDPDAAFDGGGGVPPAWLQGAAISDGAFWLNGVQIDVYATDSLSSVLARINGADAGVTAALDGGSGRIVLTQATAGADGEVTLADDTSGLLAALGLDNGAFTPGGGGDFATPLDQLSALAGVRGGTLRVNGHAIAIDTATDTLADLRARLAALGVHLDYQDDSRRFSLRTRGALTLDDGGTGLFAALGLAPGAYDDPDGARGFASPDRVAGRLDDLVGAWNGIFATPLSGTAATQFGKLNDSLRSALKSYVVNAGGDASGDTLRSGFGLDFRFRADGSLEVALDAETLERALRADAGRIEEFLTGHPTGLGDGRTAGLLDVLGSALGATDSAVGAVLNARGLGVLDVYA
jgi:hypothetical protein